MPKLFRRVLATSGVAAAVVAISLVGGAPSAQASAAAQRICSSTNSEEPFTVTSPFGGETRLTRTKCVPTAPRGSYVYIASPSYRVGYDGGTYSECRDGGRGFIPWQGADTIYFRTYNDFNCK